MQNQFSYIKLKELHKLCKGDKDRELNYLKQFLDMITVSIQKIKLAIEKGDRETIVKELHYMSPQLMFFGINDFSILMERVQKKDELSFDLLRNQVDKGIFNINKALKEVESLIEN